MSVRNLRGLAPERQAGTTQKAVSGLGSVAQEAASGAALITGAVAGVGTARAAAAVLDRVGVQSGGVRDVVTAAAVTLAVAGTRRAVRAAAEWLGVDTTGADPVVIHIQNNQTPPPDPGAGGGGDNNQTPPPDPGNGGDQGVGGGIN